jgi:hypothetical protein
VKKIRTCVAKIGKSGVSDVSTKLMSYQDGMMPLNHENIYLHSWASMLHSVLRKICAKVPLTPGNAVLFSEML